MVITIQPNSGSFKPQSNSEDENYGKVEYLDGVRRVVVQQRLSLIEALTDFDRYLEPVSKNSNILNIDLVKNSFHFFSLVIVYNL